MKSWVKVKDLCNPAFRETPYQVRVWLIETGYMTEDGEPTVKALRMNFARTTRSGVLWKSTRYVSLRRSERRTGNRILRDHSG